LEGNHLTLFARKASSLVGQETQPKIQNKQNNMAIKLNPCKTDSLVVSELKEVIRILQNDNEILEESWHKSEDSVSALMKKVSKLETEVKNYKQQSRNWAKVAFVLGKYSFNSKKPSNQ
jgi:predicted nuclease with TOPRIM domain